MQAPINEEALINASDNYSRERSFSTAMSFCRTLRLTGRAEEAQGLCFNWIDKVDSAFERAQLSIDMNYLGMFARSEELLDAVANDFPFGINRHLVLSELTIAKFQLGKYHGAHGIFRSLRDKAESENLVRLLYPGAADGFWKNLQAKFLGLSDSIEGKCVGIVREGGIGDLIMYSRYVEMLIHEGASSVVIQVPQTLQGCIEADEGVVVMDDHSAVFRSCDYVTTVFSLFARYQSSPYFPNTPSSMIAVSADYAFPDSLARLICKGAPERKIGLIWRSASDVRHEPYRSIDLHKLTASLENQSCRFFSLQVGELSEAEKSLMAQHSIVDLGSHLDTFTDTAAVIQKLDLLISIDTGPAHLASTLNCPVWLMLSQACDSRWYDCQHFTPWYSSMRLYRQDKLGDWTKPLSSLSTALESLSG